MTAAWREPGARVLVGLLLGFGAAACSGDKSSELGDCGGRGQPPCPTRPSGRAGDGAGNGNGGNGSGGSGFGNTDAMAPDLPMIDAGPRGPGQSGDADERMCGGTEIEPELQMETIPGNILLIFDKSGSMCDPWGLNTAAKWLDAFQAVSTALEPLKENVTVGAIFFPDTPTGGTCAVPQINNAPQLRFMPGEDFLTAWNGYWAAAMADPNLCRSNRTVSPVNGATPLLAALQAADAALNGAALQNTTNIVIITDGRPNCSGGSSNANEPLANLTPTIAGWQTAGYKTYVVGLPGLDAAALALLDGLAVAGGTNQHIPANDPMMLQTELAMIIGESVSSTFNSCRIGLPHAPPEPNDVNVVVVEGGLEKSVARDLGASGGWALAADGGEIVLQGLLCDLAMQGQYEKISVVFGCVEAPPLPPPTPPE
jgi:hypothetical protein